MEQQFEIPFWLYDYASIFLTCEILKYNFFVIWDIKL